MSHVLRRAMVVVVCCAAAAVCPLVRGQGPAKDGPDLSALDSRRAEYEASLDDIRKGVRRSIQAALKRSESRGEEQVKAVREQEQAFDARGELPEGAERLGWQNRYATQADGVQEQYNKTIRALKDGPGVELRDALEAEAKCFDSHWDLVPWTVVQTDDSAPIAAKGVAIAIGRTDDYRLEIKATRQGDAGRLIAEVPIGAERSVALPLTVGEGGEVLTFLTVRKGTVTPDLGVVRPITAKASTAESAGRLTLRSADGTFSLKSVRIKPVIDGQPPPRQDADKDVAKRKAVPAQPQRAERKVVVDEPGNRLVEGRVFRGKCTDLIRGDMRPEPDARLKSRTDNEIVLVTDRAVPGRLERRIHVEPDGTLTPISIRAVGGPTSVLKVIGGWGRFDGKTLTLHTYGNWSSGGVQNGIFKDELILELR